MQPGVALDSWLGNSPGRGCLGGMHPVGGSPENAGDSEPGVAAGVAVDNEPGVATAAAVDSELGAAAAVGNEPGVEVVVATVAVLQKPHRSWYRILIRHFFGYRNFYKTFCASLYGVVMTTPVLLQFCYKNYITA